jgi:thiamine kinase-like enzyme
MDQATLDRLKNRLEHAGQYLAYLMEPKEPLAVLCHGDFCRNNMLFRYDSGKPSDAVICDFQNVKYASPAIDLSLFMYLNTSSELRNQHWDDLFGEYHATMTRTLARILDCSVEELLPDYGLDEFQKDFVVHGFYGYMICSFFLSKMMEDQKDRVDLAIVLKMNVYEHGNTNIGFGGESASRCLADILKHLESLGAL